MEASLEVSGEELKSLSSDHRLMIFFNLPSSSLRVFPFVPALQKKKMGLKGNELPTLS